VGQGIFVVDSEGLGKERNIKGARYSLAKLLIVRGGGGSRGRDCKGNNIAKPEGQLQLAGRWKTPLQVRLWKRERRTK